MIAVRDGRLAVAHAIVTRPRADQDEAHLREVYASTRASEFAPLGWPDGQVRAFLAMQYAAREQSLPAGADDLVVEVDEQPAGRLIVDLSDSCLRLIDIALLPRFQGQGVGGELLARLCGRADAEGREILLHVLRGNPAADLYQRCGFSFGPVEGLYAQMRRSPGECR